MKPNSIRRRRWFIGLLTLAVLTLFLSQLMKIQIVDGDKYQNMLNARYLSTQTLRAVRGEIVDRDGVLLAGNRMGYDVQIDLALYPATRLEQNKVLHSLIELFESLGEDWDDNLPLAAGAPYGFLEGQESQIATLKEKMNLQDWATAEHVMAALVERYKLEDYSRSDARKMAAVCYEMERRDFSLEIPYTFSTDLDITSVIQIREQSYRLPGVEVVESAVRIYEDGDLAPHIIGTIGPLYAEEYQALRDEGRTFQVGADPFDRTGYAFDDIIGKEGIERSFEDYLRGQNGRKDIYVDASETVVEVNESISPTPGNTVVLTLDRHLQRTGSEALEAQIKFLQENTPPGEGKESDTGAVVALKVKTGEILVAATYPSYDLSSYRSDYTQLAQDELRPLFNRAILGEYTPGSIFKPAVSVAGLNAGIIDAGTTFNCGRVYTYLNHNFTCLGAHGSLNVVQALNYSCNIFFYNVGQRAGIDEINDIAGQLGLGVPTGIEIREADGQLSIPALKEPLYGEPWYPGDVLQASIGQMLNKFSPLQLAGYTATLANRGTRMKSTIIKEIRDYSMQEVVQPFEPKVAHQMDVDPALFETVIEGMVSASHYGTAAHYFGNYPIRIASKTGTPETGMALNSTFIAFAPADDPEIAVAVIIEKGYHGYTGAPVAKAIFDEYFGIEINAPTRNGWDQLRAQRAAEAQAAASGAGEESSAGGQDADAPIEQEEVGDSVENIGDNNVETVESSGEMPI